jgi:uncharacterized protein involved in exopolysaccharide biosynthesis
MSTQPPSIILGPRIGVGNDDSDVSDLQLVIAKVLSIVSHRRWLFLIPMLGGMAICLAVALVTPRVFTTSLILERSDDVVLASLAEQRSSMAFDRIREMLAVPVLREELIREEAKNLVSASLAGVPGTPILSVDPQETVEDLIANIKGSFHAKEENRDIISFSYGGSHPILATRLLPRLREDYIERTNVATKSALADLRTFYREKAEVLDAQVSELRMQLLATESRYPGVNPNQPDALHKRIHQTDETLVELMEERDQVSLAMSKRAQKLERIQKQIASADESGRVTNKVEPPSARMIPNPEYERVDAEIRGLNKVMRDARMLRGLKDAHPSMVAWNNKLKSLKSDLESTPKLIPSDPAERAVSEVVSVDVLKSNRADLERQQARAKEQLASLESRIEKVSKELEHWKAQEADLPDRREAFVQQQNRLAALTDDLRVWKNDLVRVDRALLLANEDRSIQFRTLREPRVPNRPDSPDLMTAYIMSGGVGLALGVVVVFLREFFDSSFRSPARVRQSLGIPVLETIEEIKADSRRGFVHLRMLLPVVATVEFALLGCMATLFYLSIEQPIRYSQIVRQMESVLAGAYGG